MVNYITEAVKNLIGFTSDVEEAPDIVERGQIRRHIQAVMDSDPLHYDDEYAQSTRFGGVVAPPLFPLHEVTRARPGDDDPLTPAIDDPDFDGALSNLLRSCAPLPIELKRILNGGSEFEIYRYARPGERVRAQSRYVDIYQKEGKTGPLVFHVIETVYSTTEGEILLKARNTRVIR